MTVFPACCGYGGNLALPRAGDGQRIYGASPEQPLEAVAAVVRSSGLESGQRRDARCGFSLLLMLERAGQIELPPVRRHIRGQRRAARPRPEAVLIDDTPL